MLLFSRKNSGFCTPAYPEAMDRLNTTTCSASHTRSTGIPAMGLAGSSIAAGLTVSLAPMTRTTEVPAKSSLISSISRTTPYGTRASARRTFMCPGSRPATGCTPKRTVTPRSRRRRVSSATGCWAWATAMPYPGVMITCVALSSAFAVSSALISRCSPCSSSPLGAASTPKPPAMTERKDRFMARHMT